MGKHINRKDIETRTGFIIEIPKGWVIAVLCLVVILGALIIGSQK